MKTITKKELNDTVIILRESIEKLSNALPVEVETHTKKIGKQPLNLHERK